MEKLLKRRQKIDKAISCYRKVADTPRDEGKVRHDAEARFGFLHLDGWNGQASNEKKAREWLLKAAAGGQEKALEWALKSSDDAYVKGNSEVLYQFGQYCKRQSEQIRCGQDEQIQVEEESRKYLEDSEKWYLAAAEMNHAGAKYKLGMLHKKMLRNRIFFGGLAARLNHDLAKEKPKIEKEVEMQMKEFLRPYGDEGIDAMSLSSIASMQSQAEELYIELANKRRNEIADAIVKDWFVKAAEQEHMNALYELAADVGQQYDSQVGRYYTDEAVNYYCRAARMEHVEAAYKLGCAYEEGWVEVKYCKDSKAARPEKGQLEELLRRTRNTDKAVEWYHKAAVDGHFMARNALGRLYWQGWDGQAQDCGRAMTYFQMALACAPFTDAPEKKENHGPKGARYLSWDSKRPLEGMADPDIRYQLGLMWENGYGWRPKNWRRAKDWYCIVNISQPHLHLRDASYQLGGMYEAGGPGLQKNRCKARAWYEWARGSGETPLHPSAEYRLARMYDEGMDEKGKYRNWKEAAKRYESYLGAIDSQADETRVVADSPTYTVGRNGDPASCVEPKIREEGREPTPGDVEYRLAVMYQEGGHRLDKDDKDRFLAKDESKALELMVRAAEHGNEKAMDWWDEKVSSLLKEDKAKKDGQDGQH